MAGFLTFLACTFLVGTAVGRTVDFWLRKSQKDRLTEILERSWFHTAESDPISIVRAPIVTIRQLFDIILGPSVFSVRAFVRTTILGLALAIAALSATGAMTGVPFAGAAPWKLYEDNVTFAKTGMKNLRGGNSVEDAQIAFDRRFLDDDGLPLRCAYMAILAVGVTLINGLLDFVCIALLRQFANESKAQRERDR